MKKKMKKKCEKKKIFTKKGSIQFFLLIQIEKKLPRKLLSIEHSEKIQ